MVEVENVGGENKVSNGSKPRITCDTLTTFVILGPKGLKTKHNFNQSH